MCDAVRRVCDVLRRDGKGEEEVRKEEEEEEGGGGGDEEVRRRSACCSKTRNPHLGCGNHGNP